jgi:hypothetical protein
MLSCAFAAARPVMRKLSMIMKTKRGLSQHASGVCDASRLPLDRLVQRITNVVVQVQLVNSSPYQCTTVYLMHHLLACMQPAHNTLHAVTSDLTLGVLLCAQLVCLPACIQHFWSPLFCLCKQQCVMNAFPLLTPPPAIQAPHPGSYSGLHTIRHRPYGKTHIFIENY